MGTPASSGLIVQTSVSPFACEVGHHVARFIGMLGGLGESTHCKCRAHSSVWRWQGSQNGEKHFLSLIKKKNN